jgi:hypothetical protein
VFDGDNLGFDHGPGAGSAGVPAADPGHDRGHGVDLQLLEAVLLLFEDILQVMLANAKAARNFHGRKPMSPTPRIRELRDLTRGRSAVVHEQTRAMHYIHDSCLLPLSVHELPLQGEREEIRNLTLVL